MVKHARWLSMLRLRYPIAVDLKLQGRRVVVGDRLLAGEPGREPPFGERASVALAPITRQTFREERKGKKKPEWANLVAMSVVRH